MIQGPSSETRNIPRTPYGRLCFEKALGALRSPFLSQHVPRAVEAVQRAICRRLGHRQSGSTGSYCMWCTAHRVPTTAEGRVMKGTTGFKSGTWVRYDVRKGVWVDVGGRG